MKTISFSYEGRDLEVRMVPNDGGFTLLVWEGSKQVSSVPYIVSQTDAETATKRGELEQRLDEALVLVRDTVVAGHLLV